MYHVKSYTHFGARWVTPEVLTRLISEGKVIVETIYSIKNRRTETNYIFKKN